MHLPSGIRPGGRRRDVARVPSEVLGSDGGSVPELLENQAAGQLDAARAHQRLAQVEVEVALAAARQRDLAALERDLEDQIQ